MMFGRVKFRTVRLQRAIARAKRSGAVSADQIVDAAAQMFAASASKAMPPRKRSNRRKVYAYGDKRNPGRKRYGFWTKVGFIRFFRTRAAAVRNSKMRYRFLAKWTIVAGAEHAGVSVAGRPPTSEGAPAKARQLSSGRRSGFRRGNPQIRMRFYARDILSPPGKAALNEGQRKAASRLSGWVRKLQAEQRQEFEAA